MWLDDLSGERYQRVCQTLLTGALRSRSNEADRRAHAFADGSIEEDPLAGLLPVPKTDLRKITVKLPLDAYMIAEKLGLRSGGSLAIPRVCEPLLCDELIRHRGLAIHALASSIDQLKHLITFER